MFACRLIGGSGMYTLEKRLENEHFIELRYKTETEAEKTTIILCDSKNKDKSLDSKDVDFIKKLFGGKIKKQDGEFPLADKAGKHLKALFAESEKSGSLRIWDESKCEIQECDSMTCFLEKVNKLKKENPNYNVYFRGQLACQPMLPSLFRENSWIINEFNMNQFVISRHVEEFKDCHSTIEKMIKLKHYNQPSRLLDIVANPLMALYFAAESSVASNAWGIVAAIFSKPEQEKYAGKSDTVLMLANLSNVDFSQYYQIKEGTNKLKRKEKSNKKNDFFAELGHQCRIEIGIEGYFNDPPFSSQNNEDDPSKKGNIQGNIQGKCKGKKKLKKSVVVIPELNNPRIIQQQGLFILCGFSEKKEMSLPKSFFNFFKVSKGKAVYFIFSPERMKEIKEQLDTYGINKSQVYFDLEKTIDYEKNRVKESYKKKQSKCLHKQKR